MRALVLGDVQGTGFGVQDSGEHPLPWRHCLQPPPLKREREPEERPLSTNNADGVRDGCIRPPLPPGEGGVREATNTVNALTPPLSQRERECRPLTLQSFPSPSLPATHVRIAVAASGINRADLFQRQNLYPQPEGTPPIPGLEVSGTIVEVGNRVKEWKRGDAVCALLSEGGYADEVVVDARLLLPIPHTVGLVEAAALPELLATVYQTLFRDAKLKTGERLLIHGGMSGIGSIAIPWAVTMGAEVFTTVSSEAKAETCRALGAHHCILYPEQDFVSEIKTLTHGAGVDVILDMVGGDYISRNLRAAAVGGRIVVISFLRGATTEVACAPLLMKRLQLIGSSLRSRSIAEKARILRQVRREAYPLIERGALPLTLDRIWPVAEVEDAHQRMAQSAHQGKMLLRW